LDLVELYCNFEILIWLVGESPKIEFLGENWFFEIFLDFLVFQI